MKAKANEAKKMVLFVAELCLAHNSGTEPDNMGAGAAWGILRYYRVCECAGRYLSAGDLSKLQSAINVFLSCYYAHSAEAQQLDENRWRSVPKFHMMEHIGHTVAPQVNPRFATCYGEKDLVGHLARIARKGHRKAASEGRVAEI